MTRVSRSLLVVSLVALAGVVGGCSTNPKPGESTASIRGNPTPEMWTVSRTHDEALNDTSITLNGYGRALNDDWKRFWMLDRPPLSAGYPTPR